MYRIQGDPPPATAASAPGGETRAAEKRTSSFAMALGREQAGKKTAYESSGGDLEEDDDSPREETEVREEAHARALSAPLRRFFLLLRQSLPHILRTSLICRARPESWLHSARIAGFAHRAYDRKTALTRSRIPGKKKRNTLRERNSKEKARYGSLAANSLGDDDRHQGIGELSRRKSTPGSTDRSATGRRPEKATARSQLDTLTRTGRVEI